MPTTLASLRQHAERELIHDILPFWARHAFDSRTGNLIGSRANGSRANGVRPLIVDFLA